MTDRAAEMENLEKILKNLGVGYRHINDPYFDNTYKVCRVFECKGVVAEDDEELCHPVMKEFHCNACAASFQNLLDYEMHYHDTHHFVCAECKKWKPTARLLEIHIQENHDSFFKVAAEKQPMYQCFVTECDMKFQTPFDRTDHCREIHKFPKNYRFDETAHLKKKVSEATSSSMDVEEITSSMDVEENASGKKKNIRIQFGKNSSQKTFIKKTCSISQPIDVKTDNSQTQPTCSYKPATMFIPRQVQQKSYAKLLTQNQERERNVLETETLMDLEKSLPNN